MNPKDKHADWLKKPMPEDDYVFVCKKCGDEIGIKYEPPTQEPERCFPFVEVLIDGTNQVIRFYRDGNSDEGTYNISQEALLDVLFNQFKWQSPQKQLSDAEITEVYKEVSEPFGEKRLYEIHDFARALLKKATEK